MLVLHLVHHVSLRVNSVVESIIKLVLSLINVSARPNLISLNHLACWILLRGVFCVELIL